ncbi:Cna protein B-type domain protein [Flavonifractor plautii]|uniref:Cna protein B-type domain protein n=1 Tax=Flavonifractor plautii TaxID=292800 RepID=A0A6N3DL43_FLAPL
MKSMTKLGSRLLSMLLALLCVLGMFPTAAFAAETTPSTIKLTNCTYNGTHYESPALGVCYMHQMRYDYDGDSVMGFCSEKGKGMGWSLEGHKWDKPEPISDPTVKNMMAYFYCHTSGVFTDQAISLGVAETWGPDYVWVMNAWVQAIVWRYKEGLFSDPATACAEELMYVHNNINGTNFKSIDDELEGWSFRDRALYILGLGEQGVWGDCDVYEYHYAGPGSSHHPSNDVQAVLVGRLTITREKYDLTIKKVDTTNPNKGLAGAKFLVQSNNGTYAKEVVTGRDGTVIVGPLEAGTYSITELEPPEGYEIDNAGPQYVVLPRDDGTEVVVTFMDTPIITGNGNIRKVDADDPTTGLPGAVIKIEGVDNSFVGTYTTGPGGYLADVPWDTMPIGSYVATEVTPPTGYTTSSDPSKVRQEFHWDGKTDVSLVFENDAKVKVCLIKLDDSDTPLPGAVFNIVKDGQIIATEETGRDGIITVPNVTEGMYAFVEIYAPEPYACLTEPVIAHVDQATVDGGGTVRVTAVDKRLPDLTIFKRDEQTGDGIPGTHFEIKGIQHGYHQDVVTGPNGKATLTGIPVDSYTVTEISVPAPYVVSSTPTQTVYLGPGDSRELVFDNLKQPELTIAKVDADDPAVKIPNTVFRIIGIDNDHRSDVTTGKDGTVKLRLVPGSYKIVEMAVPAPYYLPDKDADREQTVSLNAGDEKTLTFKNRKAPELTIYKEDSVAGAPIEGALFHVTYVSNGEAAEAPGTIDFGEILTDAKGEIRLHEQGKRLYPGEYTITEIRPAPGFQMKEPSTQKIILHGSESKTVTFENVPLNAIIVEKYDSVTHEALPGCTFQLRYLGGTSGTGGTVIGQKVTGKNGTAIWTGLKSGTYILEEVDPADGYSIIQSSETIFLADSGEQSVVTVRFENMPDGMLLIRKVCDVNPSITLQDAEFKIAYADGTLIGDSNGIFRTDENGEIRISGLKPGKSVVVTETRAPDGFILDTQSQTVQIKEGRTVSLTFKNTPKGALIIQKRDSETNKPLPGAEFRVTTAAGCEVGLNGVIGDSTLTQNGIFTTDSSGEIRITNLIPGAYVITEIKAPEGYVMDQPSTNVVIGPKGDTQTVVIKNSQAGTLIIDKRDSLTGKPLAGVTFKVTTASGEFVPDENGHISSNGLYMTDKEGKIQINGVVGTLVVTETKTIPGYTIDPGSQTQTVVVHPNDTQTLYFTNTPSTTLVIEKYIEGTTTPIKGVTFLVTDSSGAVVGQSNGEFITDEAGRIVITDLVPGTTVTARETKVPEGFVLDTTPKSIQIKEGEVQTLRFYNQKQGGLVIVKKDSVTGKLLPGVEFQLTYADGSFVDADHGHLSSKGLYTTDANGEIRITGITGTVIVKEVKPLPGYVIEPGKDTQTVEINPADTQTLTFYNTPAGGLQIIKKDEDTGERIKGVQFEVRKMNGEILGTYTTDRNGVIHIPNAESGWYTVVERKAANGYALDANPEQVCVKDGETTTLEITNKRMCSIMIHKVDARTGEGIYGVKFVLYDAGKNPIGEYTTDQDGYIYIRDELEAGKYFLRELEAADGYIRDEQYKTIYVERGKCTQIEWENSAVTGQIQIRKYSSDDNLITGQRAGSELEGAVYEISQARSGKVVGYIVTDKHGVAASDPLPLGRYFVKEVSAPAYFQLSSEKMEAEIEYPNQIIKLSAYNKPAKMGVTIQKTGNREVQPGQMMSYDFSGIANTSNVALNKFFWHDRIPTDAARAISITTGTYNQRLYYKVTFKTNLNDYRTLASNLLTSNNYSLSLNANTLGLAQGEFVTDVRFEFGTVASGFASVMKPTMRVQVLGTVADGYQIINRADVGGQYLNEWQTAKATWATVVRRFHNPQLPKTGY